MARVISEPLDLSSHRLPEVVALEQQEALERKHGVRLKFLYARMGGRVRLVGRTWPTTSNWEVVDELKRETAKLSDTGTEEIPF